MERSGENYFSKFGTFAIMAIACLWLFEVSAVGPALGVIQAAFPGSSEASIQVVMMGAYIGLAIASPIAGRLALRFDKKHLMLVGLLFYGIAGIMPSFATSVPDIILWRIITGFGAGIVVPMTSAIIADKASGGQRMHLMGHAFAWCNVGNVAIGVIVGLVMVITWKAPFYAFAAILVIFVISLFGLPNCPPSKIENAAEAAGAPKEKVKLKGFMFFYMAALAYFYCANSFFTTNAAFLIFEDGIVNPAMTGIIIACMGVAAAIAGYIFSPLVKKVKSMYTPIMIVITAIGYIILAFAYTMPAMMLGSFVTGIAMGGMVPYLNNMVAVVSSNLREKDIAMGWANLGLPVGAFLCVPIGDFIKTLNTGSVMVSDIRALYITVAIAMIVTAVITLFTRSKKMTARMLDETAMLT